MIFHNPSMHGSEFTQSIKKRNGRMDGRTNVPEAICPSNFFEVGGMDMDSFLISPRNHISRNSSKDGL